MPYFTIQQVARLNLTLVENQKHVTSAIRNILLKEQTVSSKVLLNSLVVVVVVVVLVG